MSAVYFFPFCSVILIIFVFFYSLHLTHIVSAQALPTSLRKACILNTHSSARLLLLSDLLCELYKTRRRCTLVYGSSILLLEHLHFCHFCNSSCLLSHFTSHLCLHCTVVFVIANISLLPKTNKGKNMPHQFLDEHF